MFTRLADLARNIRRSEQGAVAIQMGLISAGLLGMGALASEIGFVTYKHRQLQSAADAAVFGAATAIAKGYPANFSLEANALAAQAGFVNGANGVTVSVNNPPSSGAYAGQAGYVEVIITQPQTLSIVGAVNSLTGSSNPSGLFNVGVQAVASKGLANICMLALKTTGTAFQLNGNVTVGSPTCGIADNSASNPSTDIKGGSATIRGQFSTNGPQNTAGNNASFPDATPKTGVTTTDPYIANGENAWVMGTNASAPTCPNASLNITGKTKTGGGTYCAVSGGTLSNGVYYVDTISGAVTVNNATVVVFSNANFGNSTVGITAPTANTGGASNKGLGLVSPNAIPVSFGGNGNINPFQGAIYLPNQGSSVTMQGTVNAPCAQVIAGTIALGGNDQFGNDGTCGVSNITTPGSVKLVQ